MTSTNAYAAKRSIIDFLAERATIPGTPLDGVVVQYRFNPATAGERCIHGGRVTFETPAEETAEEGSHELALEIAYVGLYLRVNLSPVPGDDGRSTDIAIEEMADEVARLLRAEPHCAGGNSVTRLQDGAGDYNPTNTVDNSTMFLRLQVTSYIERD